MSVSVSLMRGKGDTNLFRLFFLGMELVRTTDALQSHESRSRHCNYVIVLFKGCISQQIANVFGFDMRVVQVAQV